MKIILASSSRDRKKCFELAHIPFEVITSNFDEESIAPTEPQKYVETLALGKAQNVVEKWNQTRAQKEGTAIIIGADTMVTYKGNLIGKAQNKEHAYEILSKLAGNTHTILTGVAVIQSEHKFQTIFTEFSQVHFQSLTPEEIWDYINVTDEFSGRAGAYSLQERASLFIDTIEGSPTNVIGIPMSRLRLQLKSFGINLLNYK